MRYWSLVLGLAATIIIVGTIATQDKSSTQQPHNKNGTSSQTVDLSVRGEVPDITLENYSGNEIPLTDGEHKVTVINSWASWCPFCTDELPAFAKLQSAFPDRVRVIAINRQESRNTARGFTDKQGISGDLVFLLDPNDRFYKAVGGFSMPETIFADAKDRIRIHKRGPMELPEMKEKIRQILQANNASTVTSSADLN